MKRGLPFRVTAYALACGFLLTLLSWAEICSEACSAVHSYKLYSLSFEAIGFIFFPVTLGLHFLGIRFWLGKAATSSLLAAAAGSEISFILLQKNEIGNWCPICLSIAAVIGIAMAAYVIEFINNSRSRRMKNTWIVLGTLCFACLGLLLSNHGIAKEQPLLAAEKSLQRNITFSNSENTVDVYLFTDWQCPACRKLEPHLPELASKILEEANLIFVDAVLHVDTLNFMPYNLSFMINDKDNYLKLRSKLTEISKKTGKPTDQMIDQAIAPFHYQQLQYSDIAVGSKYFKGLVDQYDIGMTPTLVVVNRDDIKKRRKLSGREINQPNIQKAIKAVKSPQTKPPKVQPVHVNPPHVSPTHVQPIHVQPTKVAPTHVNTSI